MILQGRVKHGVVVFENGPALADGTLVRVTPIADEGGNSQALIAAMEAPPHLTPEEIAELRRVMAAGKRPAAAQRTF
jgi:hypothetical protein